MYSNNFFNSDCWKLFLFANARKSFFSFYFFVVFIIIRLKCQNFLVISLIIVSQQNVYFWKASNLICLGLTKLFYKLTNHWYLSIIVLLILIFLRQLKGSKYSLHLAPTYMLWNQIIFLKKKLQLGSYTDNNEIRHFGFIAFKWVTTHI